MADTETQNSPSAPATQSPTKKEKKTKNPRAKPSHPPTSEMVSNAIKGLKERGGSSLQAIKKYIAANYKVDAEKLSPFIKKYLKASVATGSLVQTKGKGASGSFKIASAASTSASKPTAGDKKKAVKKTSPTSKKNVAGEKTKSAKKASPSSTTSPKTKKSAATSDKKTKKPAAEKKASQAAASTSKAKKSTKAGPTKKPKAPKPKSAKAAAASPKRKAASPKKKSK